MIEEGWLSKNRIYADFLINYNLKTKEESHAM
jgi:hypothetical protein